MYFVYLLECIDNSVYTGITTNIERRLKEHISGKASRYTSAHGAVRILYTEEFKDRSGALKREAEIKKLKREEKLHLVKTYNC